MKEAALMAYEYTPKMHWTNRLEPELLGPQSSLGYAGLPVFPTNTFPPSSNWSHFDQFRKKEMTIRLAGFLKATSLDEALSQTVTAALISNQSWFTPASSPTFFPPSMDSVIGK